MEPHASPPVDAHPDRVPTGSRSPANTHPFSHQAVGTAVSLLVALWLLSMLTRIALAALGWNEIDRDPSSLLAVFVHGAVIDALAALSVAANALAFGAITHVGAPEGRPRRARRVLGFAVAVAAIGSVAVAELLFWNEFGARFNAVAVDYVIRGGEAVGDVRESRAWPMLLGALAAFGLGVAWLRQRVWPVRVQPAWTLRDRAGIALFAVLAGAIAATGAMRLSDSIDMAPGLRGNVRNQGLARNGLVSFVAALRDDESSSWRFHPTREIDAR